MSISSGLSREHPVWVMMIQWALAREGEYGVMMIRQDGRQWTLFRGDEAITYPQQSSARLL